MNQVIYHDLMQEKKIRVPMNSYETSVMMDTHRIMSTVFANKARARCPGTMTFQDIPYDEEKQEEHGQEVRCNIAESDELLSGVVQEPS